MEAAGSWLGGRDPELQVGQALLGEQLSLQGGGLGTKGEKDCV